MNPFTKLSLWTVGASLAMFAVYAWLPEWIAVAGVWVGFLSVLQVVGIKGIRTLVQDGILLGVFLLIVVLSYMLLVSACAILPALSQCTPRAQTALLIADVGFIGMPIIGMFLCVRIPLLVRSLMRR